MGFFFIDRGDSVLVSVCMIVRNEEAHLERALQSIPASFEKIVVDTGSADRTVEIAKENLATVSTFQWNNDFSAARNHSISLAKGRYILVLDADEVLASDTEQQIQLFLNRYPNIAGTINIENIIKDERHKHRMVRFFPNRKEFYFYGTVHETVYYNGKPADFESTEVTIYHYGYNEEMYSSGSKTERYLEQYQQHLLLYPEDGYMLYQLGKLYYSIGEWYQALDAFERCLQINEQNKLYYPVMLVMLGYVLKELGQSKMAEELLEPFAYIYTDFPDLQFILGLLAMETGKIKNVENYFLRALQMGETSKYSSVKGVGSFKAAYNLGVYYEITGNKLNAMKYYTQAASSHYRPAEERILKMN